MAIDYTYNYTFMMVHVSLCCLAGCLAFNPGIYLATEGHMFFEYGCSCTSLWILQSLCVVCLLVGVWVRFGKVEKARAFL